jgi:hypothetical protein
MPSAAISPSGVRFPRGKSKGVRDLVTGRRQFPGQPAGQLRVHHELHAATGSTRLTRLKRAP